MQKYFYGWTIASNYTEALHRGISALPAQSCCVGFILAPLTALQKHSVLYFIYAGYKSRLNRTRYNGSGGENPIIISIFFIEK